MDISVKQTIMQSNRILVQSKDERRLFCFGSLVVLEVVCSYFLLFLLHIKKEKKVKIDV